MNTSNTRLITIGDMMKLVNRNRSTIWKWTQDGRLPSPVRVGGKVLGWLEDDINTWLQESK